MPALYRDPLVDNVGVWGIPTSTLDWCEENYAVTRYVAEFCKFLTPFISSLMCLHFRTTAHASFGILL
jgi:dihydroceramidase